MPYDYWLDFARNPRIDFTPYDWEENLTKEKLFQLLKYTYRSFYFRPGYLFKKLIKLASWQELKNKVKAAWQLLKI